VTRVRARTATVVAVVILCGLTLPVPALAYPGGAVLEAGEVHSGDFPDPTVLRVGDVWYAYGTSAGGAHVPVLHSRDPLDPAGWVAGGADPGDATRVDALPRPAAWGLDRSDPSFPGVHKEVFAPGVVLIDGRIALYYAIRVSAQPSRFCISVATTSADEPAGPFIDRSPGPLVCDEDPGGSFDPEPFVDDDDRLYLLWKSEGVPGGRSSRLWAQELSADGQSFVAGSSPTELLAPTEGWEGGIVENPSMIRWRHQYWLVYSANAWRSADYATGYARCRTVLGPCDKSPNHLLARAELELGPGGASAFRGPAGELLVAYHAWTWPDADYPPYPGCRELDSCEQGQRRLHVRQLDLVGGRLDPVSPPVAGDGEGDGFWFLGSNGTIWTTGSAVHHGEPSWANVDAVDLQVTASGRGYWVLDRTGAVWPYGDAAPLQLRRPRTPWRRLEHAAGLACSSAGTGCWMTTSHGRVIAIGDAPFLGDVSSQNLGSRSQPSFRRLKMRATTS
jgi:Glycosyl hydrolases family 43